MELVEFVHERGPFPADVAAHLCQFSEAGPLVLDSVGDCVDSDLLSGPVVLDQGALRDTEAAGCVRYTVVGKIAIGTEGKR